MRHRLLTIVLLSVVTSAVSLAAIVHVLQISTSQRAERSRQAVADEADYLASQSDLGRTLAAAPDLAVVGLQAGVLEPGQMPAHLQPEWAPLLTRALASPSREILEQELGDDRLFITARGISGNRLVWVGSLLHPPTYLHFWQGIVVALALATTLLVSAAVSSILMFRRSAASLRACLALLGRDLSTPVPRPPVRELADVADGITRMAKDLADSRETQERLSRELAQQERLAALGRVVAGVAHEVRNPLASIKLHLDLAAATADIPKDLKAAVTHASEEITRLDRLVADLLVVAGRRTGPLKNVPLGQLVRRRVDALAPWVAEHHVSMQAQGDGEAMVDPDSLGRALDNLLRNAVEASPPGSTVEVKVLEEDAALRVRVEDHGAGISPEHSTELFEPFFTTKPAGTGLGLAISRAIAHAHGGDLSYRRREGTTTFELSLHRGRAA